jgi:hypothetical protein
VRLDVAVLPGRAPGPVVAGVAHVELGRLWFELQAASLFDPTVTAPWNVASTQSLISVR